MASFTPLARATTFAGETTSTSKEFTMLTKPSLRSQSFAGMTSLGLLRRRVARSNFVVEELSTPPSPMSSPASSANKSKVVVIVDAFSTGACVAENAQNRGFSIAQAVSLASPADLGEMVPGHLKGGALKWVAEVGMDVFVEIDIAAEELVYRLDTDLKKAGFDSGIGAVVAVLAGAETGVRAADSLVVAMNNAKKAMGLPDNLLGNGIEGSEARREKYEMGEKVREAGVRAVKQMRVTEAQYPTKEERNAVVDAFLKENWDASEPITAVVKPVESAGSDGVTKCNNAEEVLAAVSSLIGSINGLGQRNKAVLVQEYLTGEEYVIDSVSSNGVHKTVAIWKYDRRALNGAGFVCCGQVALGPDSPEVPQLQAYAFSVLDALGFKYGPSHMEVKLMPSVDGFTPCLVEVGARCHGAEGFWMSIADEVYGNNTNQATLSLDGFLPSSTAFDNACSPGPPVTVNAGRIKFLLFHRAGKLSSNGPAIQSALDTITSLESYRAHEMFVKAGDDVVPTIDCFTWGGVVKLANPSAEKLLEDYTTIENLCIDGLWDFTSA
jgi:hypothetical protein